MEKVKDFCSSVKKISYSVGEIFRLKGLVCQIKKIDNKIKDYTENYNSYKEEEQIMDHSTFFTENITNKFNELEDHYGSFLYATDLNSNETICCAVFIYTSTLFHLMRKIDPKHYMKNICFDPKMYKLDSKQKKFMNMFIKNGNLDFIELKHKNKGINDKKLWHRFLSAGFLTPSQALSLMKYGKLVILAYGTNEYVDACAKLGLDPNAPIATGNELNFFAENFMENTISEENKTLLTNDVVIVEEKIALKKKIQICSEYSEDVKIYKDIFDNASGRKLKIQYFNG